MFKLVELKQHLDHVCKWKQLPADISHDELLDILVERLWFAVETGGVDDPRLLLDSQHFNRLLITYNPKLETIDISSLLLSCFLQGRAIIPTGLLRDLVKRIVDRIDRGVDEFTERNSTIDFAMSMSLPYTSMKEWLALRTAESDHMLPEPLVPHAEEWYRVIERRFAVDKIKISGELLRAIVDSL